MNVFARIRAACAEVARRAQQVRIDPERLRAFCAELLAESGRPAGLDPAHHLLGRGGDTLAYVITLDAINFGSGWFPYLEKRPGLSGYFTVASALRERFEAKGPWSASELASLDAAELARVLGQPPGSPDRTELMELFARALRDLGRFLEERHGGRFEGVVERAGGSCAALVQELTVMPLYRDVERYEELEVPFYKRAQLTAADLAAAFGGEGPGRFRDLAELTLFADNLVPHVLRREGVLRYAPSLAERIDRGEAIEAGAPEEVELRAASVHAVECCVAEARRLGEDLTAQQLDYRLWTRGQRPEYKAHPRHRTRTSFY
ncbi:MAG: queuosine salvage family protein [Candidatus Limnocylindria bacterium]